MDYVDNGIFFDNYAPRVTMLISASLDYIRAAPVSDIPYITSHDGNRSTLMMSENLDAMDWIAIAANAPRGANDLNAGAPPILAPAQRCVRDS